MQDDEQYMRRAIELAMRGAGRVAPNPMVGAVLVHDGRIISEGWHVAYGDLHAETACLQNVTAGNKVLIPHSTMYVTLEPCAHQGKQPPCAHKLVQEGIRRVVVAIEDPFPAVSGKGIAVMRCAGIDVSVGCCADEARWMNRRFLQIQAVSRPYIILKWARSVDGYIAPADSSRQQLSNHFSQALNHKWRTEESAILVGYNTALADNPRLTSRAWSGPQPLRIFLDRTLKLPSSHHLLDGSVPTWVVNEREEGIGAVQRIRILFNESMLTVLMQRLIANNKTSLIVEGGAKLLNNFIAAGWWDEARVFQTPIMLGAGIVAPGIINAKMAYKTAAGNDVLCLYQPANSAFVYPIGTAL